MVRQGWNKTWAASLRPMSEAIGRAQLGWRWVWVTFQSSKTPGLSLQGILCKNGTSHPLQRSWLGLMQDWALQTRRACQEKR